MATTNKKTPKKAKPRAAPAKRSQRKPAETLQSVRRERDQSLAREAATADILRMIARAPGDLQSVIDAIAEKAAGWKAIPRSWFYLGFNFFNSVYQLA